MDENMDEKPRKIHPIDRGHFFNKYFFCWLMPYLSKGLKREISEDDMYQTRKTQKSEMLGGTLQSIWNEEKKKREPSLLLAIFKVFKNEVLLYGVFHLIAESLRLTQPLLVSKLVSFFAADVPQVDKTELYAYAAATVLVTFIHVLGFHNYQLGVMALGMKIRVTVCSLIYRKALRLSKTAMVETTVGQMVNLLSNDVGRFDFAAQHLHNLWIAPMETVVVMVLIYLYVGATGLVGALFLLSFIPFQMYMAKLTSRYRLRTAIKTDERVRLMNEIVSGIQVIKMYTWEQPFAKLVELARRKEMQQIKYTSTIRAIMMSFNMVLSRAAICLCIVTYVLTGNSLTASYAYTVTAFYAILRTSVTMSFPQAIMQFAETRVSISRIQKFLVAEELQSSSAHAKQNGAVKAPASGVRLENVTVKWGGSSPESTLDGISFEVSPRQLVAVVGPVGGGKSTLLHVILGELPPAAGSVEVGGTISYASQEPWLFGASVRQNILFGQKFDQQKYEEVIRVCALERDLTLFPHGDRTLVGERGVSLSGGQRARINLARAVYKDADIYLLDDPLSAVDAHVGKQLFEECICGYLSTKCVVLVTHQLQYLKKIKRIYLLEEGRVLVTGTYDDLRNTDSKYSKLLAGLEEEEEETRRKSKMLEAQQQEAKQEEEEDAPVVQKEAKVVGNITWRVYKNYMKAGGNILKVFGLVLAFVLSQVLDSAAEYFVTFWVNINQGIKTNSTEARAGVENDPPELWYAFIFTSDLTIVYYSILFVLIIVIVFSRSIAFYSWCITASSRLHNKMFDNIVFSPMLFFNNNPSGRILNRFSKDIGSLDEVLPMTLLDTTQIGLSVAAISVVIGSLSPYILVPTIVILVMFYFMRVFYLQTSRDVKRIDSITRSPIYTHLTASLQGLTTIRAFGAEEILKIEFDGYQNLNSAASFMFLGATRTFGFWLDFFCVVYVACVLAILLFLKSETLGGNIGLALTQTMGLMGMFQWGMRQWSELENQMTSVERVQEYADLKPEAEEAVREPPKNWPEKGAVEFRDMSLRYAPEQPCVLRNLSFRIEAGDKVGIVGRTGAGKSSLIQALFRLASVEGSILIDGVDTKSVSFKTLRSKISIIPQEPVLFSGTFRKNLDPFDEYRDEVLWDALEHVELKNVVNDLPSGLESRMAEGGSNFSVGQRQLVCLARAIIRNNKVLVLDEATANVDPHTDVVIQATIRNKFKHCTVLTIAHRLHTIMDSDKVLVMDAGKSVEFDHPHLLLQNENGVFHSLVMQTGKSTAKNLKAIAEEKFNSQSHQTAN